jgi:hypothetical protein
MKSIQLGTLVMTTAMILATASLAFAADPVCEVARPTPGDSQNYTQSIYTATLSATKILLLAKDESSAEELNPAVFTQPGDWAPLNGRIVLTIAQENGEISMSVSKVDTTDTKNFLKVESSLFAPASAGKSTVLISEEEHLAIACGVAP